jgi:hypothetical protein
MKMIRIAQALAASSWILVAAACGGTADESNASTETSIAEPLTEASPTVEAKKKKPDPPKPPPCACVCAGTTGSKWSCQPTNCSSKDGTSCSAAVVEPQAL